MIPKTIHYCWFGRNPLPESARKCIASWRKFFPDYEIIEWNEDNFDVHAIPYTSQAYEARKYAFVSDYARFRILYEHGGIYFDTDVEVIKPFDDILARGAFMGYEIDPVGGDVSQPGTGYIAPGLGLGVNPGLGLYAELMDKYAALTFTRPDGSYDMTTIVQYTTELLEQKGLKNISGIQEIAGVVIYPQDYFNPFDNNTGRLRITANTHSIHWYSKTWLNVSPWRTRLSRLSHRLFGTKFPRLVRKVLRIK